MDLGRKLAAIDRNGPVPLYIQLRDIILTEIQEHRQDPNYVLPPESAICKKSGLGMKTVRRVMCEMADQGMVVRKRGKGTFINSAIRDREQAQHKIAVIVNEGNRFLRSSFAAQVLDGIERRAEAQGWGVSLHAIESQMPEEELLREVNGFIGHLRREQIEGVILLGQVTPALAASIQARGIRVAVADADLSEVVDSVVVRNFEGAYTAMDHLMELGHQRIAFVYQGKYPNHASYRERLRAYRAILHDRGLPSVSEHVVSWSVDSEDGPCAEMLNTLLSSADAPTAIFAGDDEVASELLRACLSLGIRVPKALSVVGFDDFDYTQCLVPPLTTVRVDKARLGREAVSLIASASGATGAPRRMLVSTQLVIRQSTAPPATSP